MKSLNGTPYDGDSEVYTPSNMGLIWYQPPTPIRTNLQLFSGVSLQYGHRFFSWPHGTWRAQVQEALTAAVRVPRWFLHVFVSSSCLLTPQCTCTQQDLSVLLGFEVLDLLKMMLAFPPGKSTVFFFGSLFPRQFFSGLVQFTGRSPAEIGAEAKEAPDSTVVRCAIWWWILANQKESS